MKDKMDELLLNSLAKEDWTLDDISNYGIARGQGGVFTLTIWKNGKTKKGDKRSITIKLDKNRKHMFLAVERLESLMDEYFNDMDFTSRIPDSNKDDGNPYAQAFMP